MKKFKQIMVALAIFLCMGGCSQKPAGKYAPVNGLNIYYEIHGSGEPLVLLHGGGSTIDTAFSKVIAKWAQTRQVIAFDQRGHGRTADNNQPFSFESSADDTAALLGYLKIPKADFFGWSNGGSIAMQIAMRHPAIVRKLVIVSAMYRRDGLPAGFWQGMEHARLQDMPNELQEAYLKVAPQPQNLQSFHDKSVQRMVTFKDWPADTLRGIKAPSLVMIGDADIILPEHAVAMTRLLPNSKLAVLPNTSHDLINERPEWVTSMTNAFLDAKEGSKHEHK